LLSLLADAEDGRFRSNTDFYKRSVKTFYNWICINSVQKYKNMTHQWKHTSDY